MTAIPSKIRGRTFPSSPLPQNSTQDIKKKKFNLKDQNLFKITNSIAYKIITNKMSHKTKHNTNSINTTPFNVKPMTLLLVC